MPTKIFKKEFLIFLAILFLFLALRLPGIHLPYHQDERKTVLGYSSFSAEGTPHPPLTRVIFASYASVFGLDNFRGMPLVFGVANLFLLFYFVKWQFGLRAAVFSSLLFTLSFYSVLESLMTEMDGQVLPFFFLLSLIAYFKWKDATIHHNKIIWIGALVLFLIMGFLTKLNFIIAVGALIIDFLIDNRKAFKNKKILLKYCLWALGLLVLLVLILLNAKLFFKTYNLSMTLNHVKDFVKLSGRAYLQIVIQVTKAIMYVSPILLVPLIFAKKNDLKRFKVFWLFLILGGVFYLVLFDFSRSALDKYLAFIIVPLSIIAGTIMGDELKNIENKNSGLNGEIIFFDLVLASMVFCIQFLPHFTPPLYPKEEWIGRILRLKWNFVFPFTGGSGPLGFYVSWLFIALSWIISIFFALSSIIKKQWRKPAIIIIFILGISYNLTFAEEYIMGKINGNPNVLLKRAIGFIASSNEIKKVISYNDIGAYELNKIGKYERRLYAAPKFEKDYINILNSFKGHYLLIDIPRLSADSPYSKYFSSCRTIYGDQSKKIITRIYDCNTGQRR